MTEYFRVPDYEVEFGGWILSAGQMLSLPMIVLGISLLFVAYRTHRNQMAPSTQDESQRDESHFKHSAEP
jgi:phosphatidylglycerol:prolipoprotein diacylglycerol transferase